jgi:hypothetical protein
LSGGPPTQTPPEQASPVVQALPSLQGLLLFVKAQPVAELHVSVVQTLPSSQTGGDPPTHAPAAQVSLVVQAFPSLHGSVLFTCMQPLVGLQESSVQPLPSLQSSGGPPTHIPPEQTSPAVHAFPSSHGEVLLVCTHTPPWHESSVQPLPSVHWLLWLHSTQLGIGVPPHTPPEQTSSLVHGWPSSQELELLTY